MAIILVSLGVFLCIFGLAGFASVIYFGFQARKQTEINGKDSRKTTFENLVIVNYLAICLSAFGLIILILGMLLT